MDYLVAVHLRVGLNASCAGRISCDSDVTEETTSNSIAYAIDDCES